VGDEMQAAHAVDLDRRNRRTAPLRQRQLLPAFPHPVGGGPEMSVEVASLLGRADDRVQRYRLQAQLPLAAHADRAGDLIKWQQTVASRGWPDRRCARLASTWCRLARRKSLSTSARGESGI